MKTAIVDNPTVASSRPNFVSDLAELVKARLTLLVLVTTAVGFYLGAEPPIDYKALLQTVFGTAAAAAGAAALNQWWERLADALMRRTRTRPIPAGRMAPLQALVLGATLSVFGVVYLAIVCNALSAVLTAITIAIYIFAYTAPVRACSSAFSSWCSPVCPHLLELPVTSISQSSLRSVDYSSRSRCVFCDCERRALRVYCFSHR